MTKTRSTKRALLTSGLVLIMCITMLIGTTFAWFTDSVTSAGNIIKSGKLDVEMYWANGTEAPDTASWTDASTGAIFNYDLWEPGYTEVRHIKIENKGNLALKYQLSIAANGEVSKLADVIDVYYVDPAVQVANRADLANAPKLGTLTEVLDAISTTASGNLKAGENHTVTLALKMQETAGNEYQNLAIGSDFSVILAATQLDFESDSFDDQYDAGLTPPDEDGGIFVEKDGIQYVYTPDGQNVLYLVPENYTNDTVVVPEGVTSIGNYAFAYNNNVKEVVLPSTVKSLGRGFDSSTVEKVVLNEGLEKIDSRAFRSTPNLKEVVISSTVKTIVDNAFQKSGIKEIVIPANVETIGEAAFGASLIEKVTFEGNTSIQGYAFRGCPNLRTVVLKGEDTTFIPSTLNGRNSMWFCNGESNNAGTSNITFYVENETVEARVKTAMGAEANNTKIYVDGKITLKVDSVEEFADVVSTATAGTVVDATGVTLVPTGSIATTITIPAGVTVKSATFSADSQAYLVVGGVGEDVKFENCDFDGPGFGMFIVAGNLQDGANMVFDSCEFKGQVAPNFVNNTAGTSTFNNCTFTLGSDGIGLVNCMGGTHTFNGCTFDYTGGATFGSNQYVRWNAVNSYSESYSTAVNLVGCNFKNCGTQRFGSNSTLTIK